MTKTNSRLENILSAEIEKRYRRSDYPTMFDQIETWRSQQVFAGLRILDATPIYFNTFPKYLSLLAGGADLTVGYAVHLSNDQAAIAFLRNAGVPVLESTAHKTASFDAVLDCCAAFADCPARYGYSELTRSGIHHYMERAVPLFPADSSRIKKIEGVLGTGDGCLRALRQLGYDVTDKEILLFGCGKIGSGIAMRLNQAGGKIIGVDTPEVLARTRFLSDGVSMNDAAAVRAAIERVRVVVSATSHPAALAPFSDTLLHAKAVLVNMGAEDEYGPDFPADRVLNGKRPLNFILPEPTQLKYIEASLALHSQGVLELLRNNGEPRVLAVSAELENMLLASVEKHGEIYPEILTAGI